MPLWNIIYALMTLSELDSYSFLVLSAPTGINTLGVFSPVHNIIKPWKVIHYGMDHLSFARWAPASSISANQRVWLWPPSSIGRHVYGVSRVSGSIKSTIPTPRISLLIAGQIALDWRWLIPLSFLFTPVIKHVFKGLTMISEWNIKSLRSG